MYIHNTFTVKLTYRMLKYQSTLTIAHVSHAIILKTHRQAMILIMLSLTVDGVGSWFNRSTGSIFKTLHTTFT